MKLVPEVRPQLYGWLAGQGGLVMLTADLGVTWQTPPGELPEGIDGLLLLVEWAGLPEVLEDSYWGGALPELERGLQ